MCLITCSQSLYSTYQLYWHGEVVLNEGGSHLSRNPLGEIPLASGSSGSLTLRTTIYIHLFWKKSVSCTDVRWYLCCTPVADLWEGWGLAQRRSLIHWFWPHLWHCNFFFAIWRCWCSQQELPFHCLSLSSSSVLKLWARIKWSYHLNGLMATEQGKLGLLETRLLLYLKFQWSQKSYCVMFTS